MATRHCIVNPSYFRLHGDFVCLTNNRFFTGYKICVYTGDDRDAGTNANVYIKLFGTKGRTEQLHLRKSETNAVQFRPGQVKYILLLVGRERYSLLPICSFEALIQNGHAALATAVLASRPLCL